MHAASGQPAAPKQYKITAAWSVIGGTGALGGWWEGAQPQSSAAAHLSIGVCVLITVALTVAFGRRRQQESSLRWLTESKDAVASLGGRSLGEVLAVSAWVALGLAVVGWDLLSFVAQSHNLPTASYFIGHVTRSRVGRGALVVAWVALGAGLALGNPRRTP